VVQLDLLVQLDEPDQLDILEILDPLVESEEKVLPVIQGQLVQLAQPENIVVILEKEDQLDKLVLEILVLEDIPEELDQLDQSDILEDKVLGGI
jgi:hypothetical protein